MYLREYLDNSMLESFTFGRLKAAKSGMRLKLGVFSDANVLNIWLETSPKVRVRLKLGVLR